MGGTGKPSLSAEYRVSVHPPLSLFFHVLCKVSNAYPVRKDCSIPMLTTVRLWQISWQRMLGSGASVVSVCPIPAGSCDFSALLLGRKEHLPLPSILG